MNMERYIGRVMEIIYMDRRRKATQRRIRILSVSEGKIKAYCYERQAIRIFDKDNILSAMPVKRHAG